MRWGLSWQNCWLPFWFTQVLLHVFGDWLSVAPSTRYFRVQGQWFRERRLEWQDVQPPGWLYSLLPLSMLLDLTCFLFTLPISVILRRRHDRHLAMLAVLKGEGPLEDGMVVTGFV